jgi:hypothetical protein
MKAQNKYNLTLKDLKKSLLFLYNEYSKLEPEDSILKEISINSDFKKIRIKPEYRHKYSNLNNNEQEALKNYNKSLFLKLFWYKSEDNNFIKKFKNKFYYDI